MRTALNTLRLVYPPVSNQEGEWLKKDSEVEQMLRKSDIYMIGQRREAKFVFGNQESVGMGVFGGRGVQFKFEIPGVASAEVELSIESDLKREDDTALYEAGDKFVRCSRKPEAGEIEEALGDVVWWYTTESLLYSKWRGDRRIHGLDNYRDFTTYDLHYVGISTEQDSYQRLLANAHHKRVTILSNETQYVSDARLTDEIYLFFFRSEPLFIHSFEDAEEISNFGMDMPFTEKQASADAEKAFSKLLQPEYNSVQFKSFPRGKNGLFGSGLASYAHVIGEPITFRTPTAESRGSHDSLFLGGTPGDAIVVEGTTVKLYRHGEEDEAGDEN
jgi:hypothetical protein